MSEPIWCDVIQQYCRCHDYGRRCEDAVNAYVEQMIRREQAERHIDVNDGVDGPQPNKAMLLKRDADAEIDRLGQ